MRKITIERYPVAAATTCGYGGLVEGERDDGSTWIMWLDDSGSPAVYFAHRGEGGETIGDGLVL